MKISKENIQDFTLATVKGGMSSIPFVGGLLAEYIGMAQSKIVDKRTAQWQAMVDFQLQKLQGELDNLTESEFFFSCIQVATTNALRAYQEEKRQLFANTIYNSATLNLDEDKKMLFLSLLDRHTLAGLKLLKYYSENHYCKEDSIHRNSMETSYTISGTEYPTKSILENNPEFNNDSEYVKTLTEQLFGDGLISLIDFSIPEVPKQARRKRTTNIGDEFLKFISIE